MSAAWLLLQGGGSQKRDVRTGKVEEAGVALGVGERADRRMHTVATPQQLRYQLARQEPRRTGNACDRVTHHLGDAAVSRHYFARLEVPPTRRDSEPCGRQHGPV